MRRALILTDADISWPPPDRFARLEQVAGLYAGLGLVPDILAIGGAPAPGAEFALPDGIGRVAHLALEAPGAPAVGLRDLAEVLRGPDEIALVHLDGVGPSGERVDAPLTVYDARDGAGAQGDPPDANIVLAALEEVRNAARFRERYTVRLPLPCKTPDTRRGTGGMVGWPGPLDGGLAGAWSGVLSVLAARGERLPAGLLLAVPERGGAPEVPPLLARVLARPGAYARPVAQRALGLGVLPAATAAPTLFDLTSLIARRCPVLTTSDMAARFEDRWHLPVSDTAEGLAGWIQGWAAGRDVHQLIEAAEATRLAFVADVDAMTRHTRGILEEALGA